MAGQITYRLLGVLTASVVGASAAQAQIPTIGELQTMLQGGERQPDGVREDFVAYLVGSTAPATCAVATETGEAASLADGIDPSLRAAVQAAAAACVGYCLIDLEASADAAQQVGLTAMRYHKLDEDVRTLRQLLAMTPA